MSSKASRRILETNGNVRKIGGTVKSCPIGVGFGSGKAALGSGVSTIAKMYE